MKKLFYILFALLSILSRGELSAQEIEFSKESFSSLGMTLPYRKATIPGNDSNASLVVYLHGGSSSGNDNETQMQEPGIDSIATWLMENKRKAIMIVPQCPTDKAWLGVMQDMVAALIKTFIERGAVAADRIYIFGGSMGGTGTWGMLSNYPDLFAAAMTVAGNPTGMNAEAVAKVPVYTVMGTADRIMKISNVETFLSEMDNYNAEYELDIEDGWTHEDVCENSYTGPRLTWVFQHTKEQTTGIDHVVKLECKAIKVTWFTASGQKLNSVPHQKGIYIKSVVYDDGSMVSGKFYIN